MSWRRPNRKMKRWNYHFQKRKTSRKFPKFVWGLKSLGALYACRTTMVVFPTTTFTNTMTGNFFLGFHAYLEWPCPIGTIFFLQKLLIIYAFTRIHTGLEMVKSVRINSD